MNYIGVDIGSTSAKLVAMDENLDVSIKEINPTGWSSIDASNNIKQILINNNFNLDNSKIVATGYGRVSVDFANKCITEITCHGIGACYLFDNPNLVIIDIGGQDTKIIKCANGRVDEFAMNDKCSAGTGRFLEIMGTRLNLDPKGVCNLAKEGKNTTISSMCTVFAESEIISLIGKGEKKENIAYGIVDSIATKVASQALGFIKNDSSKVVLTGGLCECDFLVDILSKKINKEIDTNKDARYAGAFGAAISASKL